MSDRSARRPVDRSRRVRLFLGRSAIVLLFPGILLCGLVVWHRDATHIEMARERLQHYLAPIERYIAENGTLPQVFPEYDGTDLTPTPPMFQYASPEVIRWARTAGRPVVIAYGHNNGLIAQGNGRAVIVYDRGELRVDWMTNDQVGPTFQEQQKLADGASAPEAQ